MSEDRDKSREERLRELVDEMQYEVGCRGFSAGARLILAPLIEAKRRAEEVSCGLIKAIEAALAKAEGRP